ncbi:MAG TPA: hypothetical protein VM784_06815 [Actinomycetota bacterium]|nr:hypothetical protein [Actinomycetota bacterium]
MAGTTKLVGSATSAVDVSIPRDVTISNPAFKGSDVEISGKGRFVGFALIEKGFARLNKAGLFDSSSDDGVALLGGRVGGSAPTDPFLVSFGRHHTAVGVNARIPAGDYTLYLLADDSPVSVTIKLHGLSGKTQLRPSEKVHYALKTPAPDLGGNGVTQIYSAGAAGKLRDNAGLLFMGVSERRSANVNSLYQFCYHDGKPQPEGVPLAYGPGCPGTNDAEIAPLNGTYVDHTPHSAFTFTGAVAVPQWWGLGVTTNTIGVHEGYEFFALWLSFV